MFEEGGQRAGSDTGWAHISNHDKAATVIDTILRSMRTKRIRKRP